MPRRPRLHVTDGLYHVTLRGNHRQAIFSGDADRALLQELLAESLGRYGCRVHAYCWMTNHIHLALQVSDVPLGHFVRHLASRYARTVQRRVPTTGHLFERRYGAITVDTDAYLLVLIRYIHCNPVRAGMVADPADYHWSGHRGYLGIAQVPWLTVGLGLGMLSASGTGAHEAYRRFVTTTPDPDEDAQIKQRRADSRRIRGDIPSAAAPDNGPPPTTGPGGLEDLICAVASELGVAAESLAMPSRARHLSRARAVIAHRALRARIATLTEIAARFERTPSTLWVGMQRYSYDGSTQIPRKLK
jgi:putative transposase